MYHHNRIAVILAVLAIITLASSVEAAEDQPLFIFPSEADISYVPCMDIPPCTPGVSVIDGCGDIWGISGPDNSCTVCDIMALTNYLVACDDGTFTIPPDRGNVDGHALTNLADWIFMTDVVFVGNVGIADMDCSSGLPPIEGAQSEFMVKFSDTLWPAGETTFYTTVSLYSAGYFVAACLPLRFSLMDVVTENVTFPDDAESWASQSLFDGSATWQFQTPEPGTLVLGGWTASEAFGPGLYDLFEVTLTLDSPPAHNLLVEPILAALPPQEFNPHSGEMENIHIPFIMVSNLTREMLAPMVGRDWDRDEILDRFDNCPCIANNDQVDADQDGYGDVCDPCCIGLTGNVDHDCHGITDIGDLTRLVDYMFISKIKPWCMEEADIDADALVDISDLTKLIQFLFIPPFPMPQNCLP